MVTLPVALGSLHIDQYYGWQMSKSAVPSGFPPGTLYYPVPGDGLFHKYVLLMGSLVHLKKKRPGILLKTGFF